MPQRVSPGDPLAIAARDWNRLLDLLDADQARRLRLGAGGVDLRLPAGVAWALNDTDTAFERWQVAGIDEPLVLLDDNADEFKARQPAVKLAAADEDLHELAFVACIEPIPAGEIGRVRFAGLVAVQVEWHTGGGRLAGIKTNTRSALQTGPIGWPILWHEDSGSTRWALCHAGPPLVTTAWGQLDADLDARPATGALLSAVLSLHTLSTDDEPVDTGRDITVYNPWGRDFSEGTHCQAEFDGSRWLLTGGDC